MTGPASTIPTAMSSRLHENASLRTLNAFGVDARASRLFEIRSASELADLPEDVRQADRAHRPFILGGGSNVLFTRDPPMPVVRIAIAGRRILGDADIANGTAAGRAADPGDVFVEAGAGENWSNFVDWTLAQGLAGLENLSRIPGTVGASPVQNIGAYGVEMCTRFDSLDAVSLRNGTRRRFDAAECRFAYRDSVFRREAAGDWVIVAVRFRLRHDLPLALDYGGLREELRAQGCTQPTARDVAQAVAAIRRRKLPDPAVLGNAGSFFRNPVIDAEHARTLIGRHPRMPQYEAGQASPGAIKLSAAWLIEQCGWKGFRNGDAGVHDRHALILVNHGNAGGAQIAALARRIAASVQERFGVRLEPEPDII